MEAVDRITSRFDSQRTGHKYGRNPGRADRLLRRMARIAGRVQRENVRIRRDLKTTVDVATRQAALLAEYADENDLLNARLRVYELAEPGDD